MVIILSQVLLGIWVCILLRVGVLTLRILLRRLGLPRALRHTRQRLTLEARHVWAALRQSWGARGWVYAIALGSILALIKQCARP